MMLLLLPPTEVWHSPLAIVAPSGGAAGQRPHFPLFPEGTRLYSSAFINTGLISLAYSVTGYGSFHVYVEYVIEWRDRLNVIKN